MNNSRIEVELREVDRQIPQRLRFGVLGSSSFWGEDSKVICRAVGAKLAASNNLILLTGGVPGVGETVGRQFVDTRLRNSADPATYHIIPRDYDAWDYGVTLFAGSSMLERREILARLASVYISIEGGPGTAHETEIVLSNGGALVPVGRTGGYSQDLYNRLRCPAPRLGKDWDILGDCTVEPEDVAVAVNNLVVELLGGDR